MSDVLSFAELHGQHVELLPARTMLSLFDVLNAGDGAGGTGGTPTQETFTEGGGAGGSGAGGSHTEPNVNQSADGGPGTGGAVDALNNMKVQPLCVLLCG